jgi:hypothetical protein
MKYLVYIALLIILGFGIKWTADYPVLLVTISIGWCVTAFLFLYHLINLILEKTTK